MMEEESNRLEEPRDNIEETETKVEEDIKIEEDKTNVDEVIKEDAKIEEAKPKRKPGQPPKPISQRMLMKEKMQCPDCNKTISKHCYQYKHKNCCIINKVEKIQKNKPKITSPPERRHSNACGALHPRTIEVIPPPPTPVISEREIKNRVEQFNNNNNIEETKPLDENEVIKKYFNKIKEEEKQHKQNQMKTLFNSVISRRIKI